MNYMIDEKLIIFLENLMLDDRLEYVEQICYTNRITVNCFKLMLSEGFDVDIEKFFKE